MGIKIDDFPGKFDRGHRQYTQKNFSCRKDRTVLTRKTLNET